MAVVIDYCTVSELQAANPCLNCLSEHELKAVFAYMLHNYLLPQTVNSAVAETKCWCVSKKDQLKYLVSALFDVSGLADNVQDLVAAAKCYECATPHQLDTLITRALCAGIRSYFNRVVL